MRRTIYLFVMFLAGCPDDIYPVEGRPPNPEAHKKASDNFKASQCKGCGDRGEGCCKMIDCPSRKQNGCASDLTCNPTTMLCE